MSEEDIVKMKTLLAKAKKANRIMHAEIENLKRQLGEKNSYGDLTSQLSKLETEIEKKDQEIAELKSLSGSSGDSDVQNLKTKIIVLQSKIRKKDQEIEEFKSKFEDLEIQNSRFKKQLERGSQSEEDKQELEKYKKALIKYKGQMGELQKAASRANALEQELEIAKRQLATKSQSSGSEFDEFKSGGNQQTIQQLQAALQEKDQIIGQLQTQAQSGGGSSGGGGFLAQNKFNRKINELESQIRMLKKNEQDMKSRYEEAMRKLAMQQEFDGW